MKAGALLLLAAIAGLLAWLLIKPKDEPLRPEALDPDIDVNELSQAEATLDDLDAMATPEDAEDELPDWGPGAPRP